MKSSRDESSQFVWLDTEDSILEVYKHVDRQRRRALARNWKLNGLKGGQRAGVKRAIERIVRKPKKYDKKRAALTKNDLLLLLRDRRPSVVLDYVFPDRKLPGRWLRFDERIPTADGEGEEVDLNRFSFIDNPRGTLEGFRCVAECEARAQSARINFKDKYCLDVSPYMLFTEFWGEMLPIFRGGEMMVPMQKVLAAVGIEQDLRVGFQGIEDFNEVWAFPLTRRRKSGDSRSSSIYFDVPTRDHAADRFCDALDEWLCRPEIGLELTSSGRGKIKVLLDELLENAERHSDGDRRDGSWSVAGFLAKRNVEGQELFFAHLGIVSLGDTFAVSLERASEVQKQRISDYLRSMRQVGAPQSDATLMTLAAVQDGVTCVPEADEAERGGTGLMEMLELTNLLGFSDSEVLLPQITIISGESCVQLRAPYFKGDLAGGDGGERVQWCNPENSARHAPDAGHVFDLDRGLPGTSVSIRFTLDPQYLQKIVEKPPND